MPARMAPVSEAKYAYMGSRSCGCVVAIATDIPGNADEIAKWVRLGLIVERGTIEQAREAFAVCEHSTHTDKEGDDA